MGLIDYEGLEPERDAPPGKVKIRCHSCGARYLVPQERVRGRRFRVRCRECDGVIVARCEHGSFTVMPAHDRRGSAHGRPITEDLQPSEPEALAAADDRSPERSEGRDADVWYVGIAGQPHGPHTELEIAQLLGEAEVTRKSYVWRVGDSSWRRIGDIEPFQEYLLEMQLTEIFAADEVPPESVPELSLSRLARASTLEHRQLEQSQAFRQEEQSDRGSSPSGSGERDGYEAFGEVSAVGQRSIDEDEATKLRAQAPDEAGSELTPPAADPSEAPDALRIEELSDPNEGLSDHHRELPDDSADEQTSQVGHDSVAVFESLSFAQQKGSAVQESAPQVSGRWRRPTELGMGGVSPGKLDTGAWADVQESGIHDKRPSVVRAWSGEAHAEQLSRWSDAQRKGPTLSRPSVTADIAQGPAPLSSAADPDQGPFEQADEEPSAETGEEPLSLPSIPSSPASSDSGAASQLSVGGAKLPTEMLRLIPRKVAARPQRELAPPRPTFAPPLPEEAIPPASPSLLILRKQRFWNRRRIVAAAVAGLFFLSGASVAAYLLLGVQRDDGTAPAVKSAVVAVSPAPHARGKAEVGERDETALKGQTSQPARPGGKGLTSASDRPPVAIALALPDPVASAVVEKPPRRASGRSRRQVAKGRDGARRRTAAQKRSRQRRRAVRRSPRATQHRKPAATPPSRKPPATVESEPSIEAPADESAVSVPDPDQILALGTLGAQKRRRKASDSEGLPKTLSKSEIKRVMRYLRPKVIACFDKHGNAGTLKLRVTVQPYGRAVGRVVGPLAGTPTANCVLRKLPQIRFKRFSGEPITFTYPYELQ